MTMMLFLFCSLACFAAGGVLRHHALHRDNISGGSYTAYRIFNSIGAMSTVALSFNILALLP